MADMTVKAVAPAWDSLCKDGFGGAHSEVEGKPISKDSLSGGSMSPETKGFTGTKSGAGLSKAV